MKSDQIKQAEEFEIEESSFESFSNVNLAQSQDFFNKNTGIDEFKQNNEDKNRRAKAINKEKDMAKDSKRNQPNTTDFEFVWTSLLWLLFYPVGVHVDQYKKLCGIQYIFNYIKSDDQEPFIVSFNEAKFSNVLFFGLIFCFIILIQSLIGMYFVKPLFALANKQQTHEILSVTDTDISNESDLEQSSGADTQGHTHDKKSASLTSDENYYSHMHTAFLQRILLVISVISFFFLANMLYNLSCEIDQAGQKFIEDNIIRQNFTQFIQRGEKAQRAVQEIVRWQRQMGSRVVFAAIFFFDAFALGAFITLTSICLYSTHQLSRSQKRTEED
ncbi:UNKNOWN [Stylonychia lemnae]|uniref:Transmembrane protein n=1 Tax=Stylonychia lemnae TaxID=5949 RepID=A0A077ZWM4_STYLE|nr:UNKNOWN [Stylonychia lemnae]|eukprot:CDW72881.1 UNKNOWN [Stylonychia lemnae]